jgi:hypothetical protein
MGFGSEALRTLAMVALVFGSEATLYAINETSAPLGFPEPLADRVDGSRYPDAKFSKWI